MDRKAQDAKAVAATLALVLAVYLYPLVSGRVLVDDPALLDISFNFMPNLYWVGASYRLSEFPLWDPHILCGMPHLAYTHCGGLYPPAALLLTLLPYLQAGSLIILGHALLAALLFYLVLRRLGVSPAFGAAGSLVFTLSGSFFVLENEVWMLGSTCGFLAAWLCLLSLRRRPRLPALAAAALSVGWCGLAGDSELMIYALLALGVMTAADWGAGPARWLSALLVLGAALAGGGLIMSAVALPALELVHFSVRGPQMPFALTFITESSWWWTLLPSWFFPLTSAMNMSPNAAFNSGLSPLFEGYLFPPLLAGGLAWAWRDREQRPLALAWLVLVLYVVGKQWGPSRGLIELVPVISGLQFSSKAMVIVQALSVALGFRALSHYAARPGGENFRIVPALALLAGGAGIIFTQRLCLGGPERYALAAGSALLGAAGLWPRKGRGPIGAGNLMLAAALLLAADVYLLAVRHVPRTRPERFDLPPGLAEFARALPPGTRYAVFEDFLSARPGDEPALLGRFETASGAQNILGPPRVPPARVYLYFSLLYNRLIHPGPAGEKIFNNWSITDPGTLNRDRMHLLNLAGARLILSRDSPVPYTSPYSLLRRYAFPWQERGRPFPIAVSRDRVWIKAPASISGSMSSLPGDRLRLGAGSASGAGVWIGAVSRAGGGSGLLLSRCLFPADRVDDAIGLDRFSSAAAGLELFFLPGPGAGDAGARLGPLEIVNAARPFQRLAGWGDTEAFANRDGFPRAFIAHEPVAASGLLAAADLIEDPRRFSPSAQVVLEQETAEVQAARRFSASRSGPVMGEGVEVRGYRPNRVFMEASLESPGFLVFSDTYFPGWRAWVQQGGQRREAKIYAADLAFRAVFLNEGRSAVTWVYQPVPFRIGLWAGLATLLIQAGMMAAGARGLNRAGGRGRGQRSGPE
jgi:hypothetical protein